MKNRMFAFLRGLNDDLKSIRIHILNLEDLTSIEEVHVQVEADEQRRLIIIGKDFDMHTEG